MPRTDGYTWGEEACEGLVLGLAIGKSQPRGKPLAFKLAITNRGREARKLTLFHTLDDKIRLRALVRGAGGERTIGALLPKVAVASAYGIAVTLGPGETHERDGTPLELPAELAGKLEIELVLGGVKAQPCEVKSGRATVELE